MLNSIQVGDEYLNTSSINTDNSLLQQSIVDNYIMNRWMDSDVQNMKSDVQNMKSDVQNMKSDVQNMKSDVQNMKSDVQNMESILFLNNPNKYQLDGIVIEDHDDWKNNILTIYKGYGRYEDELEDLPIIKGYILNDTLFIETNLSENDILTFVYIEENAIQGSYEHISNLGYYKGIISFQNTQQETEEG